MNNFKIYPENGRYIAGILPNGKKIEDPVVMPLNEKEYLRCRSMGNIFALIGNPPEEVPTVGMDYEDAMKLFDSIAKAETPKPVEPKVAEPPKQEIKPEEAMKVVIPTDVAPKVEKPVTEKPAEPEAPEQEAPEAELEEEEEKTSDSEEKNEEDTAGEESLEAPSEEPVEEKLTGSFSNTTTEHLNNDSVGQSSTPKQNTYAGFNGKAKNNQNRKR